MHESWERLREAKRVQQAIEAEFVRALRIIGREAARARESAGADSSRREARPLCA